MICSCNNKQLIKIKQVIRPIPTIKVGIRGISVLFKSLYPPKTTFTFIKLLVESKGTIANTNVGEYLFIQKHPQMASISVKIDFFYPFPIINCRKIAHLARKWDNWRENEKTSEKMEKLARK